MPCTVCYYVAVCILVYVSAAKDILSEETPFNYEMVMWWQFDVCSSFLCSWLISNPATSMFCTVCAMYCVKNPITESTLSLCMWYLWLV